MFMIKFFFKDCMQYLQLLQHRRFITLFVYLLQNNLRRFHLKVIRT